MSHFTVLVIGEDIENQLAPFNEDIVLPPYKVGEVPEEDKLRFIKYYNKEFDSEKENIDEKFNSLYKEFGDDWNSNSWKKDSQGIWVEYSTYNPNSKWDWYSIGGRWSDFFKLKNGKYADEAKKSDIDFQSMRDDAKAKALKRYAEIEKLFNGEIPKLEHTWDEVLAMDLPNINDKRDFYHNQPAMKRVAELKLAHSETLGFFFDIDDFNCTVEEFGEKAYNGAISTYAMLIDGEWVEKGEMGWFGLSNDKVSQDDWNVKLNEVIDKCDSDVMFTLVDCHI